MIKFPNELVQEIALQLDTGKDIKNLRLVNKTINSAAERVLWTTRHVMIRLSRDSTDAGMAILDECKRGWPAAPLIRKLRIVSLSPEWSPKYPWNTPTEPEDADVVKSASSRLPEVLPDALRVLKGLVSVQWSSTPNDECWIYDAVVEALASLPLLAIIVLGSGHRIPFPPLHKLRNGNIRKFCMRGLRPDVEFQRPFKYSMSELLHHNPNIVELDLGGNSSVTSLHFSSLFDEVHGNSIHLQTLTLGEVSIEPTPKMMSHLRSLHTLHLSGRHTSYSELWKALGLAGIALRCLTVYVTTTSGLPRILLWLTRTVTVPDR
ncbi:hypothetical protein VNI00_012837 [Paramarasmius palmivorus]|uniref:F-box domain-containing protein n=1 Tax=Paramarasmius palmivorus TaxID=297713 RepID=A0AAW0C2W4_9AGAR